MADKLVTEGRWVVGTDGSARAEKAVEWAARHVSERTVPVPLLIVHAIPEAPIPTRNAAATALVEGRDYKEMLEEKARRIVTDVAERLRKQYPNLTIETAVVEGHRPTSWPGRPRTPTRSLSVLAAQAHRRW